MILASACLAGILCKYDGSYNNVQEIIQLVEKGLAVPVCPEILGGGSVPRDPNEIVGGNGHDVLDGKARVITSSGLDCTALFVRGAEKVLEEAKKTQRHHCGAEGEKPLLRQRGYLRRQLQRQKNKGLRGDCGYP